LPADGTGVTTERLAAAPGAFAELAARPAPRRRHSVPVLTVAAVLVVAGGIAVGSLTHGGHPAHATLAAAQTPQRAVDRLDPEAAARLVVDPASTRLLVATTQGDHFAARTPSGELCLIRVPGGDLPTEVCVPDRVGADATIGQEGAGQVRLVADGAQQPAVADGWRPAGPNVWVRD
jgi:hypothetical protein